MAFIRTENNTVDNLLSVTHLTRCYFQTDVSLLTFKWALFALSRLMYFPSDLTCTPSSRAWWRTTTSAPPWDTPSTSTWTVSWISTSPLTQSCFICQSEPNQRQICLYIWFFNFNANNKKQKDYFNWCPRQLFTYLPTWQFENNSQLRTVWGKQDFMQLKHVL